MKRPLLLLMSLMLFLGCSQMNISNEKTHTIIDWVDFIKWEEIQYSAIYEAVIADETFIGEQLGEITFKVDENVTDSHYKVKHDDAAFWEEGTVLYEVKGMPHLIAVEDTSEINGYRLYQDDDVADIWNAEQLERSTVQKVEFYEGFANPRKIHTIGDRDEMDQLFDVLDQGEEQPNYEPSMDEGDPDYYDIAFDVGKSVVIIAQLHHDQNNWYWYPWELEILPNKIGDYVK